MVFSPPPRKPPVEIGRHTHSALGEMRLSREEFHTKSGGDIFWKKLEIFRWEGALNGLPIEIIPETGGPFPEPPSVFCDMLLRFTGDEPALRRMICADMLDLAKDWADSGELPEPTLDSFMAGVRLQAIQSYEDWAPTVYYEEIDEDRAIFAGHVVEARFNPDGTLQSASIAG